MKIFLILFFTLSLFGDKNDFFITLDKPFSSVLYSVVQNYDDTISAIGYSNAYKKNVTPKIYTDPFEYLANYYDNRYGKKAYLVTLDSYGNVKYANFTNIPRFSEAVGIVKTPENGYFIGGYTLDGSLFVAKLDAKGKTLFVNYFGGKGKSTLADLVLLESGDILALGSVLTLKKSGDPIFQTGLGLNDVLLTRFDSHGRKIWSKKYGTQEDDKGASVVEARDGTFIVLAASIQNAHRGAFLMRLDEYGNKIWLKLLKLGIDIVPKKVIQLRSGKFIAVLSTEDGSEKKRVRLLRFDLEGNILADKTIATSYDSELNDFKEYIDGRLVGVGYTTDRYDTDALMMVFESDLSLLCQEHFGKGSYDLFNGLKILQNGDIVAVGLSTHKNSQIKYMTIAKLKPDCTLAKIRVRSRKSLNPKGVFKDR